MALLAPGQMIRDTYEVERYLAEGAFAEVYRVKHKFLGRQAMKVFKRTGMTHQELDEMMGEAVLLSRLAHPNIVKVFDANTFKLGANEHGYFTMENIPGGSLDNFWRSHGTHLVPIQTTVEIVKQVCRGVSQAHASSPPIIHRDIKPQNILIGYEADGLRARVSDFGLAKQVNKLTLLATAAGTLAFKPPEVFTQAKGDSISADIWALGVTLYMLLTDKVPFEVAPHMGWANIDDQQPALPTQFNPEANAILDRITLTCLAPRPENRYPDANALLAALDTWKPGRDLSSKSSMSVGSISRFSKTVLGVVSTPNQRDAETLVRKAIEMSRQESCLKDAADLMEEAFNKWPSLREKHAGKVMLWRRGISM